MTPEEYLSVVAGDLYGFLKKSESNYDTHRPILLLALHLLGDRLGNTGVLITEMGSGFSSTPLLEQYCGDYEIGFRSFDNNKEWAEKTRSEYVSNWDTDLRWQQPCSLLFVDHAPGEHRHKAIAQMAYKADIIVFHDSEIGGAGNYMYNKIYPLFKYQLHYNRHGGGAGASLVSNKIDVSVFKGLQLGEFKFDND